MGLHNCWLKEIGPRLNELERYSISGLSCLPPPLFLGGRGKGTEPVDHAPRTGRVSATAAMADATPSIPSAIASLQAYSTALSAFTAAWRAVETHASSLDSTLAARLAGYTELELICSAMDGAGLLAYLTEHRDELKEPARALDAALQVAPDPGLLVLSAAATFCRTPPEKAKNDGSVKASCRLLMALLDRLRAIGFKPSPEARDEARAVAADWKRGKRIGTEVMFKQETFAFLHLVGVFGLVEDVGGAGEVLDLVVSISGRERAVEAFLVLGLDLDQHMPSKPHFTQFTTILELRNLLSIWTLHFRLADCWLIYCERKTFAEWLADSADKPISVFYRKYNILELSQIKTWHCKRLHLNQTN